MDKICASSNNRLQEATASGKGAQATARPGTSGSTPVSGTACAPVRPPGRAATQQEALRAANLQLQQKEQRVRQLESDLSKRARELTALERRASQAAEREVAAQAAESAAREDAKAARAEAAALQQTVEEVVAANQVLQAQARQASSWQQQLSAQEEELAELRKVKAALAALQQAQAEQAAAAEREMAATAEHARQAGQAAAAAEWRARLEAAEVAAAGWRADVGRLEADLERAREGLPWAPSAAEYASLARRMLDLEAAARHREVLWHGLAGAAGREAAARQEQLAPSIERALAAKDKVFGDLKSQLDSLLAAARALHARGSVSQGLGSGTYMLSLPVPMHAVSPAS